MSLSVSICLSGLGTLIRVFRLFPLRVIPDPVGMSKLLRCRNFQMCIRGSDGSEVTTVCLLWLLKERPGVSGRS